MTWVIHKEDETDSFTSVFSQDIGCERKRKSVVDRAAEKGHNISVQKEVAEDEHEKIKKIVHRSFLPSRGIIKIVGLSVFAVSFAYLAFLELNANSSVILDRSATLSSNSSSPLKAYKLWRIDGEYYNFEPLLQKHPGGQLPLLQGRGRDVSVLFQVHHLGTRPSVALKQYKVDGPVVGKVGDVPEYSFEPNGFYMTLKGRVRDALQKEIGETSARKPSTFYMLKFASNVVFFSGSWLYLAFYASSTPVAVMHAVSRLVLLGFAHDAVHTTLLPKSPSLQLRARDFIFRAFLQNSADWWHQEHIHLHHPYTKTDKDPNENLNQRVPLWRLTNRTQWAARHSFPVFSHLFISALQTEFMLVFDSKGFFRERPEKQCRILVNVAAQVFFHFFPFFSYPLIEAVKLFSLTSVFPSVMVALAFHSSHGAEDLEFRHRPGIDWGEYQLRTTSGFASSGISGTLDSHIEHHLFPMLSNDNQHFIRNIVVETAQEFGIPYHERGSFMEFIWTHFKYMVTLGSPSSLGIIKEVHL